VQKSLKPESGTSYRSWHENSEVLNHTFSVEEIIGRDKKIPAECAKPRQFMWPVHDVTNGDNLMKAFDLDQQNLYMTRDTDLPHSTKITAANNLYKERRWKK